MREVHATMFYVCSKCGHSKYMFLEKGLEERCNHNLKVKSGMKHKPVPFIIRCPRCKSLAMSDHGMNGLPKFAVMCDGMNVFLNQPDSDCGVPVFNYKEEIYG